MELNRYINKIKQIPMLTKDEEKNLIKSYTQTGCQLSKNKLLESFLKLSLSMALRYGKFYKNNNNNMDLISEANLGLIHGLQRLDKEKGSDGIATYLIFWIRAYIQNYLFANASIVNKNTTTAQKKLFFTWKKIHNRLLNSSNNNEINVKELQLISNETKISVSDIQLFIRSKNHDCTLTDNITIENDVTNPEDSNDILRKKQVLIEAIKSLKQRDREIFLARYAITFSESSLKNESISIDKKNIIQNIAIQYKLSSERIRQILNKTINYIKNYITQYYCNNNNTSLIKI